MEDNQVLYKKIHHLLKFNKIEYITKIWKFSWNIMMNEILTFKVKAISFFPQICRKDDSINKLKSNNRIRNCTFFMLTSSCGLQIPYMCCWHILWPRCFNLNPKKYSMRRLATSKMFSSSPNFQQDKWIPYISFGLSNIWRKILMQNLKETSMRATHPKVITRCETWRMIQNSLLVFQRTNN